MLELPPGHHRLDVAQLGYESMHAEIDVQENGSALLTFYLRESPLPVEEVTVTASTFGKVGKSEGAVIRRSDVVGTPGGAADVFQALRTLPGINAPNEGAAVYVRGGDPSETLIRLDGGDIGHPYHYEERLRRPVLHHRQLHAEERVLLERRLRRRRLWRRALRRSRHRDPGPAQPQDRLGGRQSRGGSASTSWALVPDRLSLIASVDHSVPQLLFDIYGTSSDYETTPSSSNSFVKLLGRYSRTDVWRSPTSRPTTRWASSPIT